jgi:leucyl aminopeptidase
VSYLTVNEIPGDAPVIELIPLSPEDLDKWKTGAPARQRQWAQDSGFKAGPGQICALPDTGGRIESYLVGEHKQGQLAQLAGMPGKLPEGVYQLRSAWDTHGRVLAALGWGLSAYRFDRYKQKQGQRHDELNGGTAKLLLEDDIADEVVALCDAQCLVRDLVNTPTEHMGPSQLADAVVRESDRYDAESDVVYGDDLLTENFPAIHAVGRAADYPSGRAPQLVKLSWGREDAPLLAIVGKGVCFDTGGLDLKSAAGMALMKKDMGGAAHALALATLVMRHELPVRLMLLIPAVENSVSGNAYRPGDVISTRKGLSVEIGNTDAEGRVILSDALALACEHLPDLVIDFATLTGAARIALGADLPPLFSNHIEVAAAIQQAGDAVEDPLWTLPLYQPYKEQIKSPIADLNNTAKSSFGGCITAALFLEHFVEPEIPWVHIDTFAWNQSNRPGRPEGGEALGLRAVFSYLQSRYGSS